MNAFVVVVVALSALALIGNGSIGRQRLLGTGAVRSDGPAAGKQLPRWRRESLLDCSVTVPYCLALELRSGRDLSSALRAAAVELAGQPEVAARLRRAADVTLTGADPSAVLCGGRVEAPDRLGARLRVTAACCSASLSTGMPLADLLEAAAAAARSAVALHGFARAELAGARSTALVLAGLPAVGLAMGQLLGARPLVVLFTTPWGAACAVAGCLLTVAGLLWTGAISRGLVRAMP